MPLQYGRYGSALAAAAHSEDLEVVEFLINKGAEVNMPLQCGEYGSALVAAVFSGYEVVEFLINKGAEVNMQLEHGPFTAALDYAMPWDGVKASTVSAVASLLIKHGAKRGEPRSTSLEEEEGDEEEGRGGEDRKEDLKVELTAE